MYHHSSYPIEGSQQFHSQDRDISSLILQAYLLKNCQPLDHYNHQKLPDLLSSFEYPHHGPLESIVAYQGYKQH